MNSRRIVSRRVPYLPVTVILDPSLSIEDDALVDTGYTGFVVVPGGSFTNSRPATHRAALRLADGSPVTAPAYLGELAIGATRLAPVLITELGDATIIGLQALQFFTLTLDHGHEIAVEP